MLSPSYALERGSELWIGIGTSLRDDDREAVSLGKDGE
jgi:hypothetical protein